MAVLPPVILIIRFSSFGDVLQSLSIVGRLKQEWPESEIHFATRSEFSYLIQGHPGVHRVWCLNKEQGLSGLFRLSKGLKAESWTHIYDCHNNLRSRILCLMLNGPFGLRKWMRGHIFLRRSIRRWKRFLLFRLRVNKFEQPFSGQRDLLKPLEAWGLSFQMPPTPQLYLPDLSSDLTSQLPGSGFVALAPSAAHALKRWPLEHWKRLIQDMKASHFVILGGPEDRFLEELVSVDPSRVENFAGRLSLEQSAQVVLKSDLLIANDTGLMHVAEQTGKPCIALMGPAPFGFPSRPATHVMQLDLTCRPCSKHGQGPCVNKEKFQKCLVDIDPESVTQKAESILNSRLRTSQSCKL